MNTAIYTVFKIEKILSRLARHKFRKTLAIIIFFLVVVPFINGYSHLILGVTLILFSFYLNNFISGYFLLF